MDPLRDLLRRRKWSILARSLERTLSTYPPETVHFLRNETDRFQNPVWFTIQREMGHLFDALAGAMDEDRIDNALEAIIKIRVVQGFSPEGSVAFSLHLKEAVMEDGAREWGPARDPAGTEARDLLTDLDRIITRAVDLDARVRRKIEELKSRELQKSSSVLQRIVERRSRKGGPAMAIRESDLFKGTSQRFITKIATNSEELSFKKNAVIFNAAERAEHFYVLVEGSVEMTVGKREGIRFTVNRAGEVFGWSALVAPNVYTATAKATKDTKVIKISRDLVEGAIAEHPAEGLALLKNLTSIIANRLRYAYQAFPAET